jgi:hypothetical protein
MNQKMAGLLARANIDLSKPNSFPMSKEPVTLSDIGGSVLLENVYRANSGHISMKDYQDRTGYECFINHIHLPCKRGRHSLLSAFDYITTLRKSLAAFCNNRHFLIIASFSDGECTVRFHQFRQDERWLTDDLERYEVEAILEIDTSDVGY